MAWFKVDDQFYDHPKVADLPLSAIGLWIKAGSYCARYETDGSLTSARVQPLGGRTRDADRLVEAGLWHRVDGGYQFHDWDQYQPTKAQQDAEREKARERMRKHRSGGSSEDVRANIERSSGAPTRPDPTPIYNTPTDDPEFTQFWDTYPNKKGKQAAFKKWQTITKTTPPSLLIEGAKKYREATRNQDPRYIKHPTTWLNAGSWEDDYTAVPATSQEMSWEQKRMAAIPFVTDEEDDR